MDYDFSLGVANHGNGASMVFFGPALPSTVGNHTVTYQHDELDPKKITKGPSWQSFSPLCLCIFLAQLFPCG